MVKETINNFESLAFSGKTLGSISYVTRKSNTDIAVVNLNDSFGTFNIQRQSGFYFGTPTGTKLKCFYAVITDKNVRYNLIIGAFYAKNITV